MDDEEPDPDDAQAVLVAASAAGRVAAGRRAGRPVRRLGGEPATDDPDDPRGIGAGGYGLHAGTWVAASDRQGLERLARYLLRPLLAKARLEDRAVVARARAAQPQVARCEALCSRFAVYPRP